MLYFITKKTSVTGKKFQLISNKIDKLDEEYKSLSNELNIKQWRGCLTCFLGGYSSLVFEETPNEKIYKRVNKKLTSNEWMPRLNTRKGREIQSKLDSVTRITDNEINQCVGFNAPICSTIGFAKNNGEYFGFTIMKHWDIEVPKDCKEVTETEYDKFFPDTKNKSTNK